MPVENRGGGGGMAAGAGGGEAHQEFWHVQTFFVNRLNRAARHSNESSCPPRIFLVAIDFESGFDDESCLKPPWSLQCYSTSFTVCTVWAHLKPSRLNVTCCRRTECDLLFVY